MALLLALAAPAAAADGPALYAEHCASCHGVDRVGGMGPALLPESLGRLRPEDAAGVIRDGRPATQMPGFAGTLTGADIAALAELIRTPLVEVPSWIARRSQPRERCLWHPKRCPYRPLWQADPLNLFVVVEAGDHHVTILDGDRFEPLARFPSRFALHGGPKFSPDGRFVHFMSRDGWVTRYDLWSLQPVAEVRVGINSRNIAISDDGRVIAVANYLPPTLVLLDAATLAPLEVKTVDDPFHKQTSRVSAVYQAAPRQSFVLALKDLPEIWEVSYRPDPPCDLLCFLTKAAARNIFYGGSLFFFVVFAALVAQSHWYATTTAISAAPLTDAVIHGKRVWEKHACIDCHTPVRRGRLLRARGRQRLGPLRRQGRSGGRARDDQGVDAGAADRDRGPAADAEIQRSPTRSSTISSTSSNGPARSRPRAGRRTRPAEARGHQGADR